MWGYQYGSNEDRRNWFICPKIWCPYCKISIREDKIVDEERCPNCNRVVIDRTKWYGLDSGDGSVDRVYGWPGFEKNSKHPKNLWIPCCFQSTESGAPKTQIINRIKTAFNVEFDPSDKNNRYIIQKYANVRDEYVYLEKSRYGKLPPNLLNLFKANGFNSYEMKTIPTSISKKKTIDHYFRVGIGNSVETRDFLTLIADIYTNLTGNALDKEGLIKKIIENITIDDFKRYNRGMLDILFMDMSDKISSLQNFIEYLTSNETIHYSHLWNLCTSPNDWLFKNGINLMLVQPDKTNDVNNLSPLFRR